LHDQKINKTKLLSRKFKLISQILMESLLKQVENSL